MNEQKMSFIICCNNEFYLNECRLYLDELIVPENLEVDIIEVRGAASMTAGCNEGMKQSDAKYKVYLHQDVFITNKNFIYDIISLFQKDEKIGLIGMIGSPYLARTGIMWDGIRFGGFYRLQEYVEKKIAKREFPVYEEYMEMEVVDGLLMATQYDLPWREDLFQKWDFYDVSQCFEFQKAGYKVVVPGQNPEWYIHDCAMNLINYEEERKKFLKEYSEYMDIRQKDNWEEYKAEIIKRIKEGYHGSKEEEKRLIELVNDIQGEWL